MVPDHRSNRRIHVAEAFTLLELVAVLSLAALMAGMAMLSMRGMGRAVGLRDLADRWIHLDEQCRTHAKRYGMIVELRWDAARSIGTMMDVAGGGPIGPDWSIDDPSVELKLQRIESSGAGSGRLADLNSDSIMAIRYSPQGISSTYRIDLKRKGVGRSEIQSHPTDPPTLSRLDASSILILICGGTGQAIGDLNEAQMDEIAEMHDKARPDVD